MISPPRQPITLDMFASEDITRVEPVEEIILTDTRLVAEHPAQYTREGTSIHLGDVMDVYDRWESPIAIVADGPYGVSGFEGDLHNCQGLDEWYEPHIKKWSEAATPLTTLWFWNGELGWATVHPVLLKYGWEYRACCIWDKGIGHIAGNANTKTLRKWPVTTEVCVHYTRPATFAVDGKTVSMKEWLRYEWVRAGIPLRKANEACGVKDAATRKYLTQCHLWYFPPADAFDKLARYANEHGDPARKPYYSIDGKTPLTGLQWENMRAKFYCAAGITNVWRLPAVRGAERIKNGSKSFHTNQKPLELMQQIIKASTDVGDVVWEPFGGLCTAALASYRLGRQGRAAEIMPHFYELAISRLHQTISPINY